MHRNVDDLFGRLLSGYGGTQHTQAPGVHNAITSSSPPAAVPAGRLRVGFCACWWIPRSVLVQPDCNGAAQRFRVDAFYTYINGSLAGRQPQQHLLSTIDYAKEFTLRLSYQF